VLGQLDTQISQRRLHVPLAYIRGKAEFYGREFTVNAHTLVPRPETETIISLLKGLVRVELSLARATFADVGTGSGAIAITAKLEFPEATVFATDIDTECLATADANAKKHKASIVCRYGNLLEALPLSTPPEILLCNLPYVPDNFQINTAATHEPRHALFGGPGGLDLYRELFGQTEKMGRPPKYLLTESLPPQHKVLTGIAKDAGYHLRQTDDFIQLFELS